MEKVGYIFILLFINSISSFGSKTNKEILQNDYQMQIAGVKNWVQKIKMKDYWVFWYSCVRGTSFICLMIHTFVLGEKNFQCKKLSGDVA